MGLWKKHVVPRLAERTLRGPELDALRDQACAPLHGDVLELGFGSGLNLRSYPAAVRSVTAIDPSDVAWRISGRRRREFPTPVDRRGLDGQRLREPDAAYDGVLSTFTLCSIPDPAAALAEVRRVLRPGGVLCVLEHGIAPDERVAAWQRRLEPAQRRLAGGCHLTRDVPSLVAAAGFEVTRCHAAYLEGPRINRPWGYGYLLTAEHTA